MGDWRGRTVDGLPCVDALNTDPENGRTYRLGRRRDFDRARSGETVVVWAIGNDEEMVVALAATFVELLNDMGGEPVGIVPSLDVERFAVPPVSEGFGAIFGLDAAQDATGQPVILMRRKAEGTGVRNGAFDQLPGTGRR